MKAFITGGSGFIGTFVAHKLLQNNVEVTIFDRREPNAELTHLCNCIQGDLLDLEKVKNSIGGHDVVYHLAANADISMGVKDTALDLQLTTIATYNVLESMRLNTISSIVFLSGSGVYGDASDTQCVETAGPLLPVSLYGASKLAAEGLISAFSNMFNMKALIFRPANIVGGGQTHGVLFDFIQKLKRDCHRLEILGDGNQTKSYLYIDDLYDAITIALDTQQEAVSVINVASADTVDVNWIAARVIEFMKLSEVQITHTKGKVGWVGDVPTVRLNTSKLRQLGWVPQYSSKEAIDKALTEILGV
ncbi:MAG: NAD-dependent epimerase/dehydratase family protein [Cyanobacteria bacterium SZAS-4]|nr:NAD-dependent epimerase/dehydratase family protein [Cyanobacteria bacterium SZAS-4]